jgi:hypothetical protein
MQVIECQLDFIYFACGVRTEYPIGFCKFMEIRSDLQVLKQVIPTENLPTKKI